MAHRCEHIVRLYWTIWERPGNQGWSGERGEQKDPFLFSMRQTWTAAVRSITHRAVTDSQTIQDVVKNPSCDRCGQTPASLERTSGAARALLIIIAKIYQSEGFSWCASDKSNQLWLRETSHGGDVKNPIKHNRSVDTISIRTVYVDLESKEPHLTFLRDSMKQLWEQM